MKSRTPLLLIQNLLVEKGDFRLEVPYLELEKGEILALVGPNGSGKTTLLMSMGLLLKPQKGEIFLGGKPTFGLASPLELRRKLVMVFQEPLLLKGTVMENVSLPLVFRGVRGRELERKSMEALEKLGIAQLHKRQVKDLSGGEAQRVNLARALAVEPELLLLDEPFSSLDPPTKDRLLEDLEGLLRTTATTAVMSTHDRLDCIGIPSRIAFIQEGRILQVGRPSQLIENPSHPSVAEFMDLRKTAQTLRRVLDGAS